VLSWCALATSAKPLDRCAGLPSPMSIILAQKQSSAWLDAPGPAGREREDVGGFEVAGQRRGSAGGGDRAHRVSQTGLTSQLEFQAASSWRGRSPGFQAAAVCSPESRHTRPCGGVISARLWRLPSSRFGEGSRLAALRSVSARQYDAYQGARGSCPAPSRAAQANSVADPGGCHGGAHRSTIGGFRL
jgi:hypothetical protein